MCEHQVRESSRIRGRGFAGILRESSESLGSRGNHLGIISYPWQSLGNHSGITEIPGFIGILLRSWQYLGNRGNRSRVYTKIASGRHPSVDPLPVRTVLPCSRLGSACPSPRKMPARTAGRARVHTGALPAGGSARTASRSGSTPASQQMPVAKDQKVSEKRAED